MSVILSIAALATALLLPFVLYYMLRNQMAAAKVIAP